MSGSVARNFSHAARTREIPWDRPRFFGGKINDYWSWSADFTRYELDQIDIDTIGVSVLWYPKFANP